VLNLLLVLLHAASACAQTGAPPTLLVIDLPQGPEMKAFKPSDRAAMREVTLLHETELDFYERVPLSELHERFSEELSGEITNRRAEYHGEQVTEIATRYAGSSRILALPHLVIFEPILFVSSFAQMEKGHELIPVQELRELLVADEFTEYFRMLSAFFKEQNIRVVSLSVALNDLYIPVLKAYQSAEGPLARDTLRLALLTYKNFWHAWTRFIEKEKNTAFVIAAGNESTKLVRPKSASDVRAGLISLPNLLKVAALNSGDGLELYSNYGEDVVQIGAHGTYKDEIKGTSFAAPRVSGTLAKIFSEQPYLTAQEGLQKFFEEHTEKHQDLKGLVQNARALKEPGVQNPSRTVKVPSHKTRKLAQDLRQISTDLLGSKEGEIGFEDGLSSSYYYYYYLQRGPDGNPMIRVDIECRDLAEGN
jgi:hypothetical protein